MENREIREFTTRGGHAVTVVTYVTGREMREINGVLYDKMQMAKTPAAPDEGGKAAKPVVDLGGKATFDMIEDRKIEICVMSLDGKTEDIVGRVLELHREDYEDVMAAVDELVVKKNDTATQS